MVRIGVSVEGATEREFIKNVLAPHFIGQNIEIRGIDIRGNVSIPRVRSEIQKILFNFDIVTTLYDYYGFKDSQNLSLDDIQGAIAEGIDPDRARWFVPYLQQYEFEALLFSSPQNLVDEFGDNKLSEIEAILQECGEPENINNNRDTCPSRRLKGLFSGYDKVFHGSAICSQIGLGRIREKCARFNGWLEEIEQKAQEFANG